MIYVRPQVDLLADRLGEKRKFIQILLGPRQTGKTTIATMALGRHKDVSLFISADEPALRDAAWLRQNWQTLRTQLRMRQTADGKHAAGILIVDEVQKIHNWSETVKALWDEDTRQKTNIKVVLLGSTPLLIQQGLTESLAGRFEIIPVPHWSYLEAKTAFHVSLPEYVYWGGYPAGYALRKDESRWRDYIQNALIETTISRDVFLLNRIDKPALFRQLFFLACEYSGQVLSYQKMMGQLQDAGNTTTLAHYLELLKGAGLISGLQKYSGSTLKQRASIPKLQVHNTALFSVLDQGTFKFVVKQPELWGRYVENAVGAHLINSCRLTSGTDVLYWREGAFEVDYVLYRKRDRRTLAIEVKSGKKPTALPGLSKFQKHYPASTALLVGDHGMPLEEFLQASIDNLMG